MPARWAVYNLVVRRQTTPGEPTLQSLPNRSTLRLREFDYSTPGAYFITICTARRARHFGEVRDDAVCLTAAGSMVASTWSQLATHYPAVQTDAFVVMPNHIHGILLLTDERHHQTPSEGGQAWEPAPTSEPHTPQPMVSEPPPTFGLSDVIHRFKSLTTRRFAELADGCATGPTVRRLWQRNYYEHVIRNDDSLLRIREYIANNPLAWALDRENPDATTIPSVTNPWEV